MRCLNRQRANIVLGNILAHGQVPTPADVSKRERIFERDGVLRWVDDTIVGHCRIGVSLEVLLSRLGPQHKQTGSLDLLAIKISEILEVFDDEAYVLWFGDSELDLLIVLKHGCTPIDQLIAWCHALLLAQRLRNQVPVGKPGRGNTSLKERLAETKRSLADTREIFAKYKEMLGQKGWDLDVGALETRAGTRAVIETRKR
jgi:hypothetical protein